MLWLSEVLQSWWWVPFRLACTLVLIHCVWGSPKLVMSTFQTSLYACTHSLCVCVVGGGGGGGGGGGESIATGLGRKPVGGCYSAEMRRPAIRSTAHDPILSYPTYQPPIQDVSLQISVPNCVPLRGYTTSELPAPYRKFVKEINLL